MCQNLKKIFDLHSFVSNYFPHSCRAWENWLFCTPKAFEMGRLSACAVLKMCGWLKLFFKMYGGKFFLKQSGRLVCHQIQIVVFIKMSKFDFKGLFFEVRSFFWLGYND